MTEPHAQAIASIGGRAPRAPAPRTAGAEGGAGRHMTHRTAPAAGQPSDAVPSNGAPRGSGGETGDESDRAGGVLFQSGVLGGPFERVAAARATRLEPIGPGTMWVAAPYLEALARAGLLSFEAMMTTRAGRLLRALPDRENWRIELPDGEGGVRGAYLKKHHVRDWRWWLRAKLGLQPVQSPGRIEARNIARLERAGVASMQLVAYGAKLHASGLLESFVLTEELAGYVQLDHFLRQRFAALEAGRPRSEERDLRALIAEVAALARRFHAAGFNHRDFYCCHFFIREPSKGQFEVRLIDLQRMERRRRLRGRWLVKDLAQLAYSAPRDRLSCTHRLAFIKAYLGVRKLRPRDKRLIRRVLAKQQAMERHLGVHP